MESNPSATAVFSSLFVTSMQRHRELLAVERRRLGGRITRVARRPRPRAPALRCARRRRRRPTAAAASRPGEPALRDRRVDGASAGNGPGRVDVRGKLHREVRLRGVVERRARRRSSRAGSSTASRTPTTRPDRTGSCVPVRAPGGPTVTPVTRRRPCAARIVCPRSTSTPSVPAGLVGAQVDDGHGRAGVLERAGPSDTPRSLDVSTTARRPGRTRYVSIRRSTADESTIPGEIVVREHRRLLDGPGREHDVPRRGPGRGRGDSRPPRAARRTRRTPASRSGCAPRRRPRPRAPPARASVSGRCSSRSVSAPAAAASAAAASPAGPPPITSTSQWRFTTSRGAWSSSRGTMPRPAFDRMNGSTMCHAQRGRWNTL